VSDVLSTFFSQLHREHLKPRGFKKERYTFTRDAGAYVERLNFQRSAWSSAAEKRFYINVGIWFPEYAHDTSGSGYFSGNHWATRVESLVPEAPQHWDVHTATDPAALSAELARVIDAASRRLAARIGNCRDEYLQRRKRVAYGRAAEA
jgi:hypothetical protein